jgi:hypothetical protein
MCAAAWPHYWLTIRDIIEEQLRNEMDSHYKTLNSKLDKLVATQDQRHSQTTRLYNQQRYPRTVNMTQIHFTKEEMNLLDKGLQYSLQTPSARTWTTLAMETEQAIRQLDTDIQDTHRAIAAKKLKHLINTNQRNSTHKRQAYLIENIKQKLVKNKAMITRADKGKTTIIIYAQHYNDKTHTFISNNNFLTLPHDPTKKFQSNIIKTLKQCDKIIDKKHIRFLTQRNPTPPTLNALPKLHKPDIPIRPIVNNTGAPTHKIARRLNNILKSHLHLSNKYNVTDSTSLARNLTKLQISDNHRLLTLDIKDLYVNIPIDETLNITKTILDTHNEPRITTQIVHLLTAVLEQNYFSYQNVIYKPGNGVAMGSPTSGTVAEIFLQHLEESHVPHFLDTHHIIYYTRYVDDIFIVYDSNLTNPGTITQHANSLHHNIKLTPTTETNYTINFLDLNITRTPTGLSIDIYRKPTTTDTTINYLSNHPIEHKMAAYRYHIDRMFALPLTNHQRKQEWAHITLMAHNNNFPMYLLEKLKHTAQNKQEYPPTPHKKENKIKWASFTYSTPLIRKVTNIFKNTNIKISFRTGNTLQHLLNPPPKPNPAPYDLSGIYAMTCNTCNLQYIGQTSRSLRLRYREHIRYIKNNDPKSAYALHILQNRHEYGPIESTMHLLKPIKRPSLLLPYEQLHIVDHYHQGKLIPKQSASDSNPLVRLAISPTTNPQ